MSSVFHQLLNKCVLGLRVVASDGTLRKTWWDCASQDMISYDLS